MSKVRRLCNNAVGPGTWIYCGAPRDYGSLLPESDRWSPSGQVIAG
jgi:hypothetical protein